MLDTSFLPTLSQQDVERAIQLIQQAYSPQINAVATEDLKRLQHELFEMQKRPEAWGLIIPLLEAPDPNVQFFGAHTGQVKIARDWEHFPHQHVESLKNVMVQLTAHAIAMGRGKVILRKLFVALTSLALKLVPGRPTRWPDWIMACVTSFSGVGAPTEHILDFLAIVAEEVGSADLLGSSKMQVQQTLTDGVPMVVHAVRTSVDRPRVTVSDREIQSAIKCFQAWMNLLPTNDIVPMIPTLISFLDPTPEDDTIFLASSEALQEIMSKSALSDGSGSKTLTEPLLLWLDEIGSHIVQHSVSAKEVGPISHSLCQLLVALGDHSTSYLALNITSQTVVTAAPVAQPGMNITRGHLVQTFLRLLLAYTGFPGYYGLDEEESEMTLGFWYLFQETLWSTDFSEEDTTDGNGQQQVATARVVYSEVVKVLMRKAMFPPPGNGWAKDQVEKFQVFRRDIGDTLINAYYVLRDDMFIYYINHLAERLLATQNKEEWQDAEATLHCIMSIQEAMDMEKTPYLSRLFGPDILGRLPTSGRSRIRKTMLNVIGAYSSWFTTQPPIPRDAPHSNLLLSALNYVVSALEDPKLCLHAANALRNLCDANRKALSLHISVFGELHARMDSVPDSEKSKLVQSITSIIQALPPEEEITPIEAIVQPIVQKLASALQSSLAMPEQARSMAILHLETLSGVAKGLTRINEDVFGLEDDPAIQEELEKIKNARNDLRMIKVREDIYGILRTVVDFWSTDAGVSHALSDFFKSITCLSHDITLISLPAGPLLELVCFAVQRNLTAAWLSLATILISQLNPPSVIATVPRTTSPPEIHAVMTAVLPLLLQCSLNFLGQPGATTANPDVVQELFSCMDRVAQDFTGVLYSLPPGALDALIQCAIQALSLQERYSLVSACNFLTSLIHKSSADEELAQHKRQLLQTHGRSIVRAILEGFSAVAPRSAVPNLIEMLGALLNKSGDLGSTSNPNTWITEILFADDFVQNKATLEAKKRFVKSVLGSRSLKRVRDAAQEFVLVARGLEGSNFGMATVTIHSITSRLVRPTALIFTMTGTSRHRSNTTGFSAFHWRRPRPSVPSLSGIAGTDSPSSSTPQTPQQPSLDLADLISSLTPPSVPSLAYARALTSLLPTAFPPPKRSLLAPIWISLCDPDVPAAIQAAGFDLLGAYFENEYREGLTTADRLTYFSLFTAAGEWAADTWEPRLKALRGMTVYGTDILGIEEQILDLLKSWIQSAFDGLLALEARTIGGQEDSAFQFHVRFNSDERNDRSERERCIILCAEFISKILQKSENLARIPDEGLTAIISFYGTLVDRAIQLPRTKGYDPASEEHDDPPSFQFPATSAPSAGPVLTGHQSHRRSASTSTSTSASTTVSTPVIGPVHVKHPAEIAVNLYLSYLSTQIKSLSPNSLQDIIPTLFRATAFCATPLSRLSIVARHQAPSGDKTQSQTSLFHLSTINDWKRETEDKITDFLAQLLSGPYASLSKLILKVWLGPPGTTPSVLNPPPLFFSGCQTPTQSPSLLPSLPFQAYPQVQQAQPRSSFGLTSLHNSPVPTQPATPNPPLDSLPALNIPQSLPTSPTAHFTMPHLPSVSSHLASLNLAQQSHPQLPTNAPLHTATSSSSSTGPTVPLPLHPTSSTLFTIHTCLGAHRTLRTTLRRSLISRLARAYMLRETSLGYIASGVATRADIDSEVTERAWPTMASVGGGASAAALGDAPGFSKELKGYEWDTVRIGRALKWAVKTWVEFEVGLEEGGIPVKIGVKDDIEKTEDREEKERLKDAVERVLEEVAGILKDLLQEVDDRSDGDRSGASWIASDTTGTDVPRSLMEEDESVAIGEALFELAGWIKRAKNPDGTPYVIRLRPQSVGRSRPSHSMSAFSRTSSASTIPTQSSTQNPPVAVATKRGSPSLILTLTTLLSRSHFATPLRPSLSLTLTSISGNLGDVDLAPLPDIMMRTSELNPTSLEWLDNWSAILGISDASEQSPSVGTVVGMTAVASGDKAQGLSWMERVVAERESGQWEQGRERLYEGGRGLVGLGSHLNRRKTREEVMIVLDKVYDGVRDMGTYRGALADVVCGFAACALTRAVDSTSSMSSSTAAPDQTSTGVGEVQDEFEFVWRLLADEVVLRIMEGRPLSDIEPFLDLLLDIAGAGGAANALPSATIRAGSTSDGTASGATSPATSRMQSEYASTGTSVPAAAPRENATGGSGLISSLLSLAAGTTTTTTITADDPSVSPVNVSTATQTTNTMSIDVTLRPLTKSPQPMVPSEAIHTARSQCGVFALVSIFGQLVFSPLMLEAEGAQLVVRVYDALLNVAGDIAGQSTTTEARLTALAFLMRLRADADHRVFLVDDSFDANSSVEKLAGLIGRLRDGNGNSHGALSPSGSIHDRGAEGTNRARTRVAQERVGRRSSRGRGQSTGPGASLRSLSRSPIGFQSQRMPAAATPTKPRDPLWYHPQIWPFAAESDLPSESVTTHNTAELEPPNNKVVLPVDKYLEVLINLLQNEKEWELISYALCHLPVQLANRRFFYGGKSPAMLSRIANVLCSGLLSKTLAAGSARQRDAQGLAHYTLEILISYWRCLDLQQRHMIVEVFLVGLNEQPSTVKCCLHALTLAAFELPVSITKYMPRILESLSQIMSNPDMAVYILAFLCIAVSLPPLYANFTEDDFKTVFGVALQYLQHYSRHNASPTVSWALSQHVRILSYYAIYIWFLAVRLPDRPRYIKFITRQLLIANEGNDSVDSATEVCFDWLARYTYATADPRPANSLLADILMNSADSTKEQQSEATVKEKTWVVGNAVVTIRALGRLGWLEVLTRRPSGFTKFLCRVENAPMVGPGEVDLDSISAPAVLLMERDPPQVLRAGPDDYESPLFFTEEAQAEQMKEIFDAKRLESQKPPRPDPVTGYIWKGSAPSQRRKEVVVDPSYFAIQLSPYPSPPAVRLRADQAAVPKFISTIDRVPVIDTHKVGILYVAPGQTTEVEILRNTHGSPAYTRFLEGLGRLISLRGQLDVYAGGLDPDEDGEYAYAWWDDIGQILYHTATMMPTNAHDPQSNNKKRHIGNDYVRIVWNDSGSHYRFDTLSTQFQFVNIVIEPHPRGTAATYSNTSYENEYFKVTVQRAPGMTEFVPVGNFKLISGQNLPLLVRQLGLLADWFASIFAQTNRDTTRMEVKTNWQMRLEAITRFKKNQPVPNLPEQEEVEGIMSEENYRDFTLAF